MAANPTAFRSKFRTMAQDPFAFYRGSACLFYADVTDGGPFAGVDDAWVDAEGARRIWIQGDLHAENFGTYLDARRPPGLRRQRLRRSLRRALDVGHAAPRASLGLLGWQKALPDESIDDLVEHYARGIPRLGPLLRRRRDDTDWALTLATAPLRCSTRSAAPGCAPGWACSTRSPSSRIQPTFADRSGVRRLDDDEADLVKAGFDAYLDTVPDRPEGGTS